jgi:predicted dinucleotide-binding enzyme
VRPCAYRCPLANPKGTVKHTSRTGAGSRDPSSDKTKALLASQPGASADAVAATADWAEIIILATPSWDPAKQRQQIREAAAALGPGAAGKPLIDVINGLSAWPALALPWTGGPSSSEILQEALPDTPVYKGGQLLRAAGCVLVPPGADRKSDAAA